MKGGPEGLEDTWEAGISTVEGDIYIEKAVRSGGGGRHHRAAPEDPAVTVRPGWIDGGAESTAEQSASTGTQRCRGMCGPEGAGVNK